MYSDATAVNDNSYKMRCPKGYKMVQLSCQFKIRVLAMVTGRNIRAMQAASASPPPQGEELCYSYHRLTRDRVGNSGLQN